MRPYNGESIMIRTILAAALLACIVAPAEARQQHKTFLADPGCNVIFPCEGVAPSPRGERVARQVGFGAAQKVYTSNIPAPKKPRARRTIVPGVQTMSNYGTTSPSIGYAVARAVSGIVAPLAAKVSEIQSSCGSSVISGVRHTYIAGTRHISLHASGKAVDMTGNPGCIYAHLTGWGGGYSTDYARMAHVHISYDAEGGREMGIRFVHGGGRRYAHRHHHRYASAQ